MTSNRRVSRALGRDAAPTPLWRSSLTRCRSIGWIVLRRLSLYRQLPDFSFAIPDCGFKFTPLEFPTELFSVLKLMSGNFTTLHKAQQIAPTDMQEA